MRTARYLPGLALVVLLALAGGRAAAMPQLDLETAPTLTIAFVDNDNVDLMWTDSSPAEGYDVKRDGIVLTSGPFETILEKKFYRDSTPVKGLDYEYAVCARTGIPADCSAVKFVTVGDVEGTLYKDATWDGGTYSLAGDVTIETGATLYITAGTVDGHGTAKITASPGRLAVQGGAGNLPVIQHIQLVYTAASSIAYADLGSYGEVVANVNMNIQYSKVATINLYGGVSSIKDNPTLGRVNLTNTASASLSNNASVLGVKLRNDATATISNNTFISSIDMGGKTVTIEKNNLGGVLVWPKSNSTATIKENKFINSPAAIKVAYDDSNPDKPPISTPSHVTIQDNLIQKAGHGIWLGPESQFQVTGNTIVFSTVGIYGNTADGYIQNNCIAGNTNVGLYWEGSDVDATYNWWGHTLGPSYVSPARLGDLITQTSGGNVLAESILETDNCADSVRNLKVAHMSVIQPTQTLGNSVQLVGGKDTEVWVYIASTPRQVPNVTASLIVKKGDEVLGEQTPIIHPNYDPDTFMLSDGSFNFSNELRGSSKCMRFKIPKAWQQGTLTLIAEVNPSHAIKENNYEDNFMEIPATFQAGGAAERVGVVPVSYTAGGGSAPEGTLAAPAVQQILDSISMLRQMMPAADFEPRLLPAVSWPYLMKKVGDYNPNEYLYGKQMLNRLRLRYLLDQAQNPAGPGVTRIYSMFPLGSLSYGMSEPPSQNAGLGRVAYNEQCPGCLAHEVLNNVGFSPSPPSQIGDYGYDLENDVVYPPTTQDISTFLIGSPASQVWIGPATYQALLTNILKPSAGFERLPTPTGYVIASGIVKKDTFGNKVTFDPAWEVSTAAVMENPPVGTQYALDLLDAGSSILSSRCFDLPGLTSYSYDGFTVVLPLNGTPARLRVRSGCTLSPEQPSAEIGSLPISLHPPQVALTSPNGGETLGASAPASWTASDSNGDSLTYSLLYSPDNGSSWLPVSTGITQTSYTLDLSLIPGSTTARLRVIASDGFHTAQDDSNGIFTVSNKAPLVQITSPASSPYDAPLGLVDLAGSAYDIDDGMLAGASLAWTSSLDGGLGSGESLTGVALSEGIHLITLTALDSGGLPGSAAVVVTVGETKEIYLPVVRR